MTRTTCLVAMLAMGYALKAPAQEYAEPLFQDSEMMSTMDDSGVERYIRSPVLIDDATPQPTGTMDFRLRFDYVTESNGVDRRDGRRGFRGRRQREGGRDDDIGVGLQWVWGTCEDVEVSLDLPINLGDATDNGDGLDGNADLTFGMLWRLLEEGELGDWAPAFALSTRVRTPTGNNSSGVDAELRGHLTKTLVGDMRGHANAFLTTVNGNNDELAREFQWGFVFGMDTPLTDAQDWWLIMDYMHRSSEHRGNSNMNILEAGLEWKLTDAQSLHFSTQVGLDDNGDTPNWGARMAYTHQIMVY